MGAEVTACTQGREGLEGWTRAYYEEDPVLTLVNTCRYVAHSVCVCLWCVWCACVCVCVFVCVCACVCMRVHAHLHMHVCGGMGGWVHVLVKDFAEYCPFFMQDSKIRMPAQQFNINQLSNT